MNKVAQTLCRSSAWRPLLLPAMFWLGMSGGASAGVHNMRDAAMRLARSAFPSSYPRLVMSRRGGGLALWCEGGYDSRAFWGSRCLPLESPVHLGTSAVEQGETRGAVNAQGAATVLGIRTVDRTRHLLAASYTRKRGWGSPVLLDSTGLALAPQVLLDDEGNAVACWHRFEPSEQAYHFLSAWSTPAGWSAPCIIGKDQLVPAGRISGNGSGAAVALWNAAEPAAGGAARIHNTWARHFDPVEGWGGALPLGREIVQEDGGDELLAQTFPGHHAPVVSINAAGDVLALWQEVSAPGMDHRLQVARLERGKGWSKPQQLAENPLGVSAALSDGGVASVGLIQGAGWTDLEVYMSSLTVATDMGLGWISEKVLDNYPYFCLTPSIALGKGGEPLVTWVKGTGTERELWAATRSLSGWSSGERLDREGRVEEYETDADEAGNILVVWTEAAGSGRAVWGRVVPVSPERHAKQEA